MFGNEFFSFSDDTGIATGNKIVVPYFYGYTVKSNGILFVRRLFADKIIVYKILL